MGRVLVQGDGRHDLIAAARARGIFLVSDAGAIDARLILDGRAARCSAPALHVVAGGEAAIVVALDAGADDAIGADASAAHITARLAALLRRTDRATVRVGDLVIDRIEQSVMRGGMAIDLLPREYRLLLHLARRPGAVVGKAALRQAVWGLNFDPGTNLVEVHISRLRAKLDRGFAAPMLLTEKGIGYRLVAIPSAV